MSLNKRMIYIWDENLDFYDQLKNKSELINLHIKSLRKQLPLEQTDIETELQKKLDRLDARTTN